MAGYLICQFAHARTRLESCKDKIEYAKPNDDPFGGLASI